MINLAVIVFVDLSIKKGVDPILDRLDQIIKLLKDIKFRS